jgi:hypothetical protein
VKKYITNLTYSTSWRVEAKIKEVEVDRETEASVWVEGRRQNKITGYEVVHDTWDDAHRYLLVKAAEKVESARRKLEEHKSYLGKVKGMKKPA